MSKRVLILTAIVLVFSACQLRAAVINSTWVGGDWGEWGNASNWNPAIVPDNNGNTFVVTINSGAGEVDVGLAVPRTINRLDTYGNVELDTWTIGWVELTIYDGLTNHGELEIDEIDINGNVANLTGAELELYDMEIEGNLYNQAGAFIQAGEEASCDNGNIYNSGEIFLTPGGEMWAEYQFQNSGFIEMYGATCSSNQTFDNQSAGEIRGYGAIHSDQLINNSGLIASFGGSLILHSSDSLTNTGTLENKPGASLQIKPVGDVSNSGTIKVNAGGGVAFDCNLVNETGAEIELLDGILAATTITQTADANFSGFGGITGDLVINPNGIITLTGPTNIVGDVEIGANATLEISDGTTLVTGHTTNNGTIRMIGGRIIRQGGFTNNGDITWSPAAGCRTCLGDFDGDGWVTFQDLYRLYGLLWIADDFHYFEHNCGTECVDMDGDGWITTADLVALYNEIIAHPPDYEYRCQ